MVLSSPLPFVEEFINELDKGLKIHQPELGLSRIQRGWRLLLPDGDSVDQQCVLGEI